MQKEHIINRRTTKQLNRMLLSFSNMSRGIFISLFGLVINYLLINYKSRSILDTYVYCISFVNLLLVFSNWGGKDYSIKTLTAQSDKVTEVVRSLINSRLVIFLALLVIVILLPSINLALKVFIALYLFLKTINSIFESLIAIQKEFHAFVVIDLLLNVAFLLLILFDNNTSHKLFLAELLVFELLKLMVNAIFFRKFIHYKFDLKEGFTLIMKSQTFFYLSLAGFICAKADLYIVGLYLNKHLMSQYFIILNLASLSQVCYATFVSTFSSNIFRYNQTAFAKFSAYSLKSGVVFSIVACFGVYLISNFYYKIEFDLVFALLMFSNIFFFTQVLIQMYHHTRINNQKKVLLILLISGIINVALSIALTETFGIKGAFLSNTICIICILVQFRILSHGRN